MRAKLKISKGSNAGKVFEVDVPQFVIGRAPGCNLRPQSDAVSRQHCAILLHADHVSMRDLKSRNGTIVNGEKITAEEKLSSGDELQVGPLHFEVLVTHDDGTVIKDHEPAAEDRFVGGIPSDSGLISDWLIEEDRDERTKKLSTRETKKFEVVESDFDEPTTEKDKKDGKDKKGKQEFGKLPKVSQDSTVSSRDAAAETLKKMFNRGS